MPRDINELRRFLNHMVEQLKSQEANFLRYNTAIKDLFSGLTAYVDDGDVPVESKTVIIAKMIQGKQLLQITINNIVIPEL